MKNKFKKIVKCLYVITPFKGSSLIPLKKTILSLKKNKSKTLLKHLIIFDKSIDQFMRNLPRDLSFKESNNSYQNFFIKANNKGIYSSINQGLDHVPLKSYYLVLGAGDLFLNIKDALKVPENKIIIFPYRLSNIVKKDFITKLRYLYGGMPYCHNAIAYLNDGSKYAIRYGISADYDHLLRYFKNYDLKIESFENSLQKSITIEFESVTGLSSKNKISKNIQNIFIIYRLKGINKIFNYFCHTLSKLFKKFWIMN